MDWRRIPPNRVEDKLFPIKKIIYYLEGVIYIISIDYKRQLLDYFLLYYPKVIHESFAMYLQVY
jgi:hypothetical protein